MSDTVSTNPTESAGERQTPTPLTDKECERTDCDYYLSGYVDSDFARTLERERAQKELDRRYHMDAINRLAKYLDCYETSDSIIDRAISDLTAARQRIEGLEAMVEKADKAMWDATGELASLADVVASALRNTQMYAVAEEMGGQPDLREYIWMLSYAANTQRSRAESAESRLAAVEAERDAIRLATIDECVKAMAQRADHEYCVGIKHASTDACLGVDYKMEKGLFSRVNLEAHEKVARYMGAHYTLYEVVTAIRHLKEKSHG